MTPEKLRNEVQAVVLEAAFHSMSNDNMKLYTDRIIALFEQNESDLVKEALHEAGDRVIAKMKEPVPKLKQLPYVLCSSCEDFHADGSDLTICDWQRLFVIEGMSQ